MNALYRRIIEFMQTNRILMRDEKILVALSGGPDSVFLLHFYAEIAREYGLHIEAFHLNHMIRTSAGRDESFALSLCKELGIVCYVYRSDVRAISKHQGISLEEAGREERYRIMSELVKRHKFDKVATAHQMDDNAETVLMHLTRGTGLKGLAGIPVRRGELIRPLLCVSRQELMTHIDANHWDYCIDETNAEETYFRNRIRAEMMPFFTQENPSFARAVLQTAEITAEADRFFTSCAEQIALHKCESNVNARYKEIAALAPIVQVYVFLRMMCALKGNAKNFSYTQSKKLSALIADQQNTVWSCDVSGAVFRRQYEALICELETPSGKMVFFEYPVSSEGIFLFPELKCTIEIKPAKKMQKNANNRYIKLIDYDKIKHNLYVRNKKEGDFFYPLGMDGKKSIKKYLIDKKIERFRRDRILLLCDGSIENSGNAIVCVLGCEMDDRYKVTEKTNNILQIEYITEDLHARSNQGNIHQ